MHSNFAQDKSTFDPVKKLSKQYKIVIFHMLTLVCVIIINACKRQLSFIAYVQEAYVILRFMTAYSIVILFTSYLNKSLKLVSFIMLIAFKTF